MLRKTFLFYVFFCISSLYSQTLVFGVVPQQSANKIYKNWQPFIQHLSKETGVEILLQIEKSIPEFEKKLYAGAYDIAYSNPYHYINAYEKVNHHALVRFNKELMGILVSKKGSGIKSLNDVKGKMFSFPSPKAFAATILTKSDIMKITSYDLDASKNVRYVNSHDSVYLTVQRNLSDIGGGILRTFNSSKAKNDLQIIYVTDGYPSHPISINADTNINLKEKIKTALLKMPQNLTLALSSRKLIATSPTEYDRVQTLSSELKIGK